jgi:outer membrane receptor protein involved in Fe transport
MNPIHTLVSAAPRSRVPDSVSEILSAARRRGFAATLGVAALVFGPAALLAQEAPAAPAEDEPVEASAAPVEEMVITGTRIARAGYDAPTPVSVVTAEQMAVEAPANVTDFVNTLPPSAAARRPPRRPARSAPARRASPR